jgi:plastocyanin
MRRTIRVVVLVGVTGLAQFLSPALAARAASPISTAVSMIASSTCGTGSGFCFSPATISTTVGAPVAWTNTTGVFHTATDDGGAWDTSLVGPGQTATISFPHPGTYAYHCSIHSDMHGTVVVNSLFTAASTQQYTLANSDGSVWHDLDTTRLSLAIAPKADATALISANADLWTANSGFNQDLGIDVNGTIISWKESGGFAGTFSPNAAFVQTVFPMTAGTTYVVKLKWKSNKPAAGASLYAGAGPIGAQFSPTRLTAQLVPSPSSSLATAVSTQQYTLSNSNGTTWTDIDAINLGISFTPSVSGVAVLGGNADLWTETAGFNQDLGVSVNGAIAGWKESGGFAGTFSPNAAFVQAVVPMTAATTYMAKLQWKANKGGSGSTVHAGAGPIGGQFSPTRLTLLFIPSGASLTDRVSTQQYTLSNSDGSTWTDMDAANLSFTVTPTANTLAVLSGNADLFTGNAGFNQDLAIDVNGTLAAWKESGGFAGTFSPNAAMVQGVISMSAATTYTVKLRWKTNKSANGTTIYAGAGPIGGQFSPTRLDILLVPA